MGAEQARAALAAHGKDDFDTRALRYMREIFPQSAALEDDVLAVAVAAGCDRARAYGLEDEADLMAFVDLQWRLGDRFDLDPNLLWARTILLATDMSPAHKVAALQSAYRVHVTLASAEE